MNSIYINTQSREIQADLHTPVALYLKIRASYAHSFLLESMDYQQQQNSISYIGCELISAFELQNNAIDIRIAKQSSRQAVSNVSEQLQAFMELHKTNEAVENTEAQTVFGYTAYDAIPHFEKLKFAKKEQQTAIPEMFYGMYRFLIVFDHYHNKMRVIENCPEGESSQLDHFIQMIHQQNVPDYSFETTAAEQAYTSATAFKENVRKAKAHCQAGDVFQMVLSRRFSQQYKGDEFQVYRQLRALNPSPYLFFYDLGGYSIFGSSPEAQLLQENNSAEVHPIAGTFKRTGDMEQDRKLAEQLLADPKENAEHVMLVDLARNDLGKHSSEVTLSSYKEVQYFSHVIHLVSKVSSQLETTQNPIQVFIDCFPAGTLSGAPKYKAMTLIDTYENSGRNFYGGAIGFFALNGDSKHAIMIRSALAKGTALHYQAGAGIVIHSEEESELQEVNNKLAAMRNAIRLANSKQL